MLNETYIRELMTLENKQDNDETQIDNWEKALEIVGDVVRPDATDGTGAQQQAIARSYTVNRARQRLKLHKVTIQRAVDNGLLTAFIDPENNLRIPAKEIESLLQDEQRYEMIAANELVNMRDIADALGIKQMPHEKRCVKQV